MFAQLTESDLLNLATRNAVKRLSPKIAELEVKGDGDSEETWQTVANFYELPRAVDVLREHGLWTICKQREFLNVLFALEKTADRLLLAARQKDED